MLEDRRLLSHLSVASESASGNWNYTGTYVWTQGSVPETVSSGNNPFKAINQGGSGEYSGISAGAGASENAGTVSLDAYGSAWRSGAFSSTYQTTASANATVQYTINADPGDQPKAWVFVDVNVTNQADGGGSFNYSVSGWTPGTNGFLAQIGDSFTVNLSGSAGFSGSNPTQSIEVDGTGSVGLSLSAPPPIPIVTTPDTQPLQGAAFGTYLPGVNLNIPFTVTDTSSQVASIRAVADGNLQKISGGSGKWTFTYDDPGLPTGNYPLVVTALDAHGKTVGSPQTYHLTVAIPNPPLALDDVQANYQGTLTDVQDLRFINSITATDTFSATIDNLPDYYKNTEIGATLGGQKVAGKITADSNGGNLRLQFSAPVGKLTPQNSALDVLLGKSAISISKFGATPDPIPVVNEPSWLKASKTKPTFDSTTGAYSFSNVQPPTATISAPPIPGGDNWFSQQDGGLETFASLTVGLSADIPLKVPPQVITFTVNSLALNVQVLDIPVLRKTLTSQSVTVGGGLDPKTLEPSDLSIALAAPISSDTKTLFNKEFTVPIPTTVGVTLEPSIGLHVSGQVTLDGAGVELNWDGSQIVFVSSVDTDGHQSGTFIRMTPSLTVTGTASIKAGIAGFQVGTIASASVTATLAVTADVGLNSPVTGPPVVTGSLVGKLQDVNYDWSLFGTEDNGQKVNLQNQQDPALGPWTLFDVGVG
jgi:hypothetical protein